MNAMTTTSDTTPASNQGMLHAIDFEDVALTPAGVHLVRQAAVTVLRERVPFMNANGMTLGHAVAMFIDRVFWEEGSGRLFMCAELNNTCYCLPVPARHWRLDVGRHATQ